MLSTVRFSSRLGFRAIRWNSTTANSLPPLMAKFRSDLKTAMREKDKPRLNVLRALISETNNAAKTSSPIQTDLQLLSLIKKKVAASKDASRQFAEANRADLKETEDSQIAVLEEYADQVETISLEEIKATVSNAITQLQREGGKLNPGLVLKTLLAPGGALDGKPADKSEVAQVVKELLPKN
ncbi:Yqey-like protein-domain-containing protein [Talaromyces proteolyticus]|uniref:Altered inheritance of mitochondria protein 41 n=1 Tax=Talaromyces proteolyticus TaxID=1131652 RepID=A0AAD4KMP1_9EURO|nr:Yqey-like protein-domain-containing protein [Talaromyces proteolyticus]KAH8691485.1 Yqey-like protein-domain-containing protein [Talaromyces proteolyticus]